MDDSNLHTCHQGWGAGVGGVCDVWGGGMGAGGWGLGDGGGQR